MALLRFGIVVALGIIVVSIAGCSRHTTAVRRQVGRLAPADPTWGPQAEGLQCRLRPVKRSWPAGESPTFRIDLRNHGVRMFAFLSDEQIPVHGFAIDGRWRRWPNPAPVEGRTRALSPGVEILDLPAALPAETRGLLAPGRHVIQLAFSFEGVEVLSNRVEIEIVGSRQ